MFYVRTLSGLLNIDYEQEYSGQSYKHFTIVNYNSRGVPD